MAAAHMEAVLDALVAKLNANLAAKITAVNADYGDGFTLDPPHEITVSTRAELAGFPTIMVLPEQSDTETDVGTRILWRHRVRAVTWVSDYEEEALGRRLLRYQRAVRETLLTIRTSSVGGWQIVHERDEYGPVFQPEQEGHFIQAASSLFVVKQQQDV